VTDTDASPPSEPCAAWTPPSVEVQYAPPGFPGYAAIVALHGEHDLDTHRAILDALEPIFGDVLLDLSRCPFIDSTVIGVIVSRAQVLRREGHHLELVVPPSNAHVARVVDIVGLRSFLTVHPSAPGLPLRSI
jgi:anti-sigma B factor antagonist